MRVKSILSLPWAFRLYQKLIGAPASHRRFIEEFSKPRPKDRVIDLGCGTGASVGFLPPGVFYVGVDISEEYINSARSHYGDRGTFICADLTSVALDQLGPFDLAISFGVLHHLDDAQACAMLQLARRILRPGGRLVTLDPCYVGNQPKVARFLNDHDRGKYIRHPDEYRRLFGTHGEVDTVVLSDMLRIPYTMIVATMHITP